MTEVLSVSAAIPVQKISSTDMERELGLPPGWIETRTGVRERPIAENDQATSELAIEAARQALEAAEVSASAVHLCILATSTPDYLLPPSAPRVAFELGLTQAGAIGLAGACAGFLYGLSFADAFLQIHGGCAVIIGANVLSRRVDPLDPRTAPLFSDGAGAMVLGSQSSQSCVRSVYLGSDGSRWNSIWIPAGGSRQPMTVLALEKGLHRMHMDFGQALFREAVRDMTEAGKRALARANITPSEIDWWVPHQANQRITKKVGAALGIPVERTIETIDRYGNNSSATIPIALATAMQDGKLQRGNNILLTAVGAGIVSAGMVLTW